MSAYVPEFVYGFTGWDENNQPTHGLIECPAHLKPRQDNPQPAEMPDIALTKKGETYAERALAEADGVFFLTIDRKDHQSIAASIERLIALLDEMDSDPDLEECGDLEPSLGWPDGGRGCVPFAKDMRHDDDRELDDADDEDGGDTEPNGDETDHSPIAEELGPVGHHDGSGHRIARSMLAKVRVRRLIKEAGGTP